MMTEACFKNCQKIIAISKKIGGIFNALNAWGEMGIGGN